MVIFENRPAAVVRGRLGRDARSEVQDQGWDDGDVRRPHAEIRRAGEGERGRDVRALRICKPSSSHPPLPALLDAYIVAHLKLA